MDYLDLIKKFWKLNEKLSLGSNTIALYFLLLNEWEDNLGEDFEIGDRDLSKKLNISRPTLRRTKKTLRNHGLIQFQIQEGITTIYRISNVPFSSASDNINTPKESIKNAEKKKLGTKPKLTKKETVSEIVENTQHKPVVDTKKAKSKDIPTIEEFLAYAKTLEIYDPNVPNIDFKIKTKYETWKSDGWKNGLAKDIRNWRLAIKGTLPFMIENTSTNTSKPIEELQTINRPKTTYNE